MPAFQTITRPSVTDPNKGSCIDNMFVKLNSVNYTSFKLSNLFNDHFPLFLATNKIKSKKIDNFFSIINYNKLTSAANKHDWLSVLSISNPNEATIALIRMIQGCIKLATVNKTIKKNNSKYIPRKEWITKAIIVSCERKEFLYKIWQRDPNNLILKNEYKLFAKILDKTINEAKKRYDKKQIESNLNNPKNLWNIINQKLGKDLKRTADLNYIIDENNSKIYDSTGIGKNMNSYFCNIGNQLSNKIKAHHTLHINYPSSNLHTIFITPTTRTEIINIINNMKLKCGGVDNINTKTIKCLSNFIVDPLVHIINLSIDKSIWPDELKKAEIKPIHKAKSKHHASNYRPISLISNLAKIFEKVIFNRILSFVKKHKILSKMQYGFMKKIGTKDALSYLTNLIYDKLDKSMPIAVTFLDLAKAFDTVNHDILINKLHCYGIRGKAQFLISSYLCNRYQRVKINNCVSDYTRIDIGVPQGTVLGPLLFILYVNDLLLSLPNDTIISFADDTAVISTDKKWDVVESKMNNYLNKIYNWLTLNKLSLNIEKSVFMSFKTGDYGNNETHNINVTIDGRKLLRVESHKYLGIIFDYKMQWKNHIEYIINKTKYLIFIFYKISKLMTTETLRMIYYALFHSVITYGIIAWGGAYAKNLILLQNHQNRILKIINKNNFIVDKNPLNIKQTYTFECLKFHYTELSSIYLNSNSITRNKSIIVPRRFKSIGGKSNYVKATSIFNVLPLELKIINNVNARKIKLKKWITTNIL